jgi:HEAT repeat protein
MSKIPWALAVVLAESGGLLLATTATTPQDKAWDILQHGAEEKSVERRAEAIHALGLLPHDNKAREMAESALDDSKPEVRAAAATALGDMLSRASIRKLSKTLSDQDPVVVLAAAHSLLTLQDHAAYDVYYAVLTGQRKASEGLVASERKMLQDPKKLAEFGVETGLGFVPLAGFGISAVKMLTKDESSNVRAAAARILAKDPDPQSRDALVEALSDRSWVVRCAALEAIAVRGDPNLRADIEPSMDDSKDAVQYAAAAAVIRLSGALRAPAPVHRKAEGSK